MKGKIKIKVFEFLFLLKLAWSGHAPQVPAGHRVQYYLIQPASGRYKYGYDTGANYFGKQHGDYNNQVKGQYAYKDPSGHDIGLRYTAGVQGFVPVSFDYTNPRTGHHTFRYHHLPPHFHKPIFNYALQYAGHNNLQEGPNADGSYHFSYSTDDQAREENADASGTVRGSYWYINKDGKYDLSYIAGVATGFQPTGGNLAAPVHLPGKHIGSAHVTHEVSHHQYHHHHTPENEDSTPTTDHPLDDDSSSGDASYSFKIDTDEYQREETSDSEGNIQRKYSYQNKDGEFDLEYQAGSDTGFIATGGNLDLPETVPKVTRSEPYSHVEAASHYRAAKPHFVSINANLTLSTAGKVPIISGNILPLQAVKFPSYQHSAMNGVVLKSFVPLVSDKEKYGYVFESKD